MNTRLAHSRPQGLRKLRRKPFSVAPALAILLIASASCDTSLVAPSGSSIVLAIGSTILPADGGQTTATALVTEQDGIAVKDGTRVVFIASGGDLCESPPDEAVDCNWASIITVGTKKGIASARLRAGGAGAITLDARSGGVNAAQKTITASALTAPANSKVVLDSEPDTIKVGGKTAIRSYLTTAEGAPVPNATRVVFSATGGTLSRNIVLTQEGFADAVFTGSTAGTAEVSLVSGTAKSSVSIVILEQNP